LDKLTPTDVLKLAETARKYAECFGRKKIERVKTEELEALYGIDLVERMKSVVKINPETVIGKKELEFEDIQPLVDEALKMYGRTRETGIPSIAVELVYGEEMIIKMEELVKEELIRRGDPFMQYRC